MQSPVDNQITDNATGVLKVLVLSTHEYVNWHPITSRVKLVHRSNYIVYVWPMFIKHEWKGQSSKLRKRGKRSSPGIDFFIITYEQIHNYCSNTISRNDSSWRGKWIRTADSFDCGQLSPQSVTTYLLYYINRIYVVIFRLKTHFSSR